MKRNCAIGTKTFPHRHCQITVAYDRIILANTYRSNVWDLIPVLMIDIMLYQFAGTPFKYSSDLGELDDM